MAEKKEKKKQPEVVHDEESGLEVPERFLDLEKRVTALERKLAQVAP